MAEAKTEFYNRKEELAMLTEKHAAIERSGKGVMLAIYGRRRVGKTELIKKFIKKCKEQKLYFYVDLAERVVILNSLSKAIKEQLNEDIILADFEDFFNYLTKKSDESGFILVIDEFQRFSDVAPEFITSLQKHWDNTLKNSRVMVFLVGSSIGMVQKITSSKAGALYGRAQKIKISPFRYIDFRRMFSELDEEEKVLRYGVFGGTPFYLEKTKPFKNTLDAVHELVIKKDSELSEEPKNLLEYENVRIHAKYNSILQSISAGKEILNEIKDFTKMPASSLPPYINRLDGLLDLVRRNDPINGKERLGRYKITDNFFRFWYKFVFENQSALNMGARDQILKLIKKELNAYIGRIFEDIIREMLILYNGKEINGHKISFENIGSWWDRNNNEVDILAYNSRERSFLVGEVKWSSEKLDVNIVEELARKSRLVGLSGSYKLLFVSKSGFTGSALTRLREMNALYLDLNDMKKLYNAIE
ncbi:ATP-binding protein [Candidatus Woesearchaeota archaeon]|nr:ATP-binding protein [Candidatus Woesearchaeota archaeon]